MAARHDEGAEDIIDGMMAIMDSDDGLQPPRNKQKRSNGANQFNEDYQDEYENRGKEQDQVSRVRHHNSYHPKLRDELDARKSIIKVTTIDGRRLPPGYDPSCSACAKIITLNELQRKNVRPKCQVGCRIGRGREGMRHDRRGREHERTMQIGGRRSRITKAKSNSQSHRSFDKTLRDVFSFSKNGSSKSMQCPSSHFVRHQNSGTSNNNNPNLVIKNSKSRLSNTQTPGQNSRTSQNKSQTEKFTDPPGSKAPSISSYNSFMSINHEPMVS